MRIPFPLAASLLLRVVYILPLLFVDHESNAVRAYFSSLTGKSTFLNVLSGRVFELMAQGTASLSGSFYFNDKCVDLVDSGSAAILSRFIACVPHHVHMVDCLTVEETMKEAAELQLPFSWSKARRLRRVQETLADLMLLPKGTLVAYLHNYTRTLKYAAHICK